MSDPLSKLLATAGVRGSLISRAELGVPFGVVAQSQPRAVFHVPVRGSAVVEATGRVEPFGPGDVVVLPRGAAHTIRDASGTVRCAIEELPRRRAEGRLPVLLDGRERVDLDLLCGTFQLGAPADRWLLDGLPELVVVRGTMETADYLRATVALLNGEVARGGPGADIVSDRLVEVLVVHVLRGFARESGEVGWFAGVADPSIGRVLRAVHQDPSADWSLDRMARVAALSRTRFVARFRERVGQPPNAWLTRWRIAVAQRALRDGAPVSEAATRTGYASEASFTRAFKRVSGHTPSAWRRAAASS